METRAPAVVAVVVTTGPAPHLGATLASLAGQDYAQLSVLVLENGDPTGMEAQVQDSFPSAFVRQLERNDGYARATNEAIGMVEGATFLCLCHDDVVLAPDAVHLMVEEAYRSNAGIVTPKVVRPDDSSQLVHVGLNADRFGATTERVEPGEVDQGQHDNARDVFVAPGGVTLVRADLFATLGGFDESIVALGEDLDLCWRAAVAGSRVVVAPEALVAHHELLANGARVLTAQVTGRGGESLAALSRRHRLSTMLTCYGLWYLALTIPMLVALEIGECAVAAIGRDRDRVRGITGAWRWNLSRLGSLRARRRALRGLRELDDHEVRRLQVTGASRLTTFGTRLVHEGVDVARGALATGTHDEHGDDERLDHTVGFGAAFSDDSSFDELDDLGHREGVVHARVLSSTPVQVAVAVVIAVCFAFGVRDLVATHLPLVGRLAPVDSWWTTWRHFFASWSPAGVGSGAAGSPGYGVLGVAGTFVFGRMGILPRAALVGAMPLGAVGIWRLVAPIGSLRARLVAAIAYVLLALGPNLVAQGRIDVLAALAIVPFVIRRLLVTAGVRPFGERVSRGRVSIFDPRWRSSRQGRIVVLGLLESVVVALDPSVGIAVLVAAIGLFAGGLVVGAQRPARVLGAAMWSSLVVALLLAPLTIDTIASGSAGVGVFGAPGGPWSEPGLGGLIRLAVGPFGVGALSWLLPAAALLALVVGRADRFVVASRLAGMGAASLLAALLVARHLLGSFTPDVATLLVPYAVAVAALIGTGVAAFEQDVASARFGWRQVTATVATLAVLASVVPFVQSTGSGRFDLPSYGYDTQFASLLVSRTGDTRTLWLGDPRSVPLASWTIEPGLAFATSTGGLPGGDDLFAPPSSGAAQVLADDVVDAMRGRTVQLGRLLAAAGITSIVVVAGTAPTLSGTQQALATPLPRALLPALRRQQDLAAQPGAGGVTLFINTAARGILATRSEPLSPTASPGSAADAKSWTPALDPVTWSGPVASGTLLGALAPSGDFTATVDGKAVPRSSAFGWAESWNVPAGTAKVSLSTLPLNAVLAALVLALWACACLAAIGLDRLRRLSRFLRRRGLVPVEPDVDPALGEAS
jgi:GT2 family glycosyltransferase